MLSFWLNDYLAVLPNTNLVTNIGFDASATHTRSTRDYRSRIRSRAMPLPLVHPDEVRADEDAERRITQRVLEDEHHMYRGAAGVLRRAEHAGVGLASAVRQHVLTQRARGAS